MPLLLVSVVCEAKNWDVFYADAVPQDRSGFSFVLHNQRVWYFGGYPMTITVESQLTRFNDLQLGRRFGLDCLNFTVSSALSFVFVALELSKFESHVNLCLW